MKRLLYAIVGSGVAALLLLLAPSTASAHERRDVGDGQYRMVVGFLDEPAFAGEKNGLDLRVAKLGATSGTPGAGAAEDEGTPVEVIYGDQTMDLELDPVFNQPGAYRAIFFPAAEGDYSFHIVGDIEGVAIDETFTSSPDTFSAVEAVEPYQFPKEESSNAGNGAAMLGGNVGGSSGGGPGTLLAAIGAAAVIVAVVTVGRLARHRQPSSLLPVRS